MNGQHLRAFLWLRWRLFVNQMHRSGIVSTIILALMAVSTILLAFFFFVGSFCVGLLALKNAPDPVMLYIWDGIVVAFLFLWAAGLMAELQRSDALALEKFLHLPVSLSGVFALNYLSSLVSVSLALVVPAMLGFALGLACARGATQLLLLPLVVGFLFMVTAVTYQFQGWLASLMANKRRRRTIIVLVTGVFLLFTQLPNLVNLMHPWKNWDNDDLRTEMSESLQQIHQAFADGAITAAQFQQRQDEIQRRFQTRNEARNQEQMRALATVVRYANIALPPGWLPLGALALAERDFLTLLLCLLGMTLIGSASLWRAYLTTLRLFIGQFTASRLVAPAAPKVPTIAAPAYLLEKVLPGMSEQASALALANFRSLTRAPEAKMLLLTPVLFMVIFGGLLFQGSIDLPDAVRPLLAYAAMAMILFSFAQLVGNQFGFDRSGFRIYVLCPAARRDILLGKNLSVAPLALVMSLASVVFVEVIYPLRIDHLLALVPQWVSMYLLFCILANWLSILSPMPVATGTLKPANPKLTQVLVHMIFMFFFPLGLAPTLFPLGIELGLEALGWVEGVPIFLLLALLECGGVVYLYQRVLVWQGDVLQRREQAILNMVVTKVE